MPRVRGVRPVIVSWRALIGFALRRSALGTLLLGAPRLAPPEPVGLPTGPLGAAVRSHRLRLWRGRALYVLTRALTLSTGWLLLVACISWRLAAVPPALFWVPVACCMLGGLWLAFAQRPSALETARLLDRRFRLRDALGTAVELSYQGDQEAVLAQRHMTLALGLFNRVPHTPWAPAPRREWLLAGVLAAASLVFSVTAQRHTTSLAAGLGHGGHATATGQHPLTLAQSVVAPRVGGYAAIHAPGSSSGRITASARIPQLSLSLQIHPSAQGGQSASVGANPYLTGGSLPGGGGGSTRQGAKGAKGSPGAGSSGGQGQQGTGNGSPQSGGTGGQGGQGQGQGQNGLQAPQSGQQGGSGQSGQSNPSGTTGPNQNQIQPQSGSGAQDPNTPPSANPFGQDQPRAGSGPSSHASQRAPNGRGQQAARQPSGTGRGTGETGKRTGTGTGTASHAPNGPDDPAFPHRGQRGSDPSLTQQPHVVTHRAGPATGPQITLGGHYVISPGDPGQGLVRIEPEGTATGTGLQSAGYAGSATVQGYVPEDATTLSPAEQALVRAYFSGDGN